MRQALQALALLVGGTLVIVALILGTFFSVTHLPYRNATYQTALNDFKDDLQALGFEPTQQPISQDEAGETVLVTTFQLYGCGVEVVRQADQELAFNTVGAQRIEAYAVRMVQRGEDYAPYVSPNPSQVEEFLTANRDRYPCYTAA